MEGRGGEGREEEGRGEEGRGGKKRGREGRGGKKRGGEGRGEWLSHMHDTKFIPPISPNTEYVHKILYSQVVSHMNICPGQEASNEHQHYE